jgi:hypothetical protein
MGGSQIVNPMSSNREICVMWKVSLARWASSYTRRAAVAPAGVSTNNKPTTHHNKHCLGHRGSVFLSHDSHVQTSLGERTGEVEDRSRERKTIGQSIERNMKREPKQHRN